MGQKKRENATMSYSILIVDDSKSDRYIIDRFLRKSEQFDVISEVEDGQEAIDFFVNGDEAQEGFPPDAVILDINMPRMNGFEFLEKYRELKQERNLKTKLVVLLTSSAHEEDKKKANEFDEVGMFITKPFKKAHIDIILDKLRH